MRKRTGAALGLLFWGASAFAQDLPSGYGTPTPSGSSFTTAIQPATDTDDYAFQGFPGTTLKVVAKPTKGSVLKPAIDVIRPDGVLASDEHGIVLGTKGSAATASLVLDVGGWWTVRVRSADTAGWIPEQDHGYTVQVSYKTPGAQSTYPPIGKSFTRKAAIDSTVDLDEFRFQGYQGQRLTLGFSRPKGSFLLPLITIFRPDGEVVEDPFSLDPSRALAGAKDVGGAAITMDQTGIWRVQVEGMENPDDGNPQVDSGTTGAYVLSVKLAKFKPPPVVPDADGRYRFPIPAAGGATVSWSLVLQPKEPRAKFKWMLDPTGRVVSGINGAAPSYKLPDSLPIGDYAIVYDAPAGNPPTNAVFKWKVVPPKAKPVNLTLSPAEPAIVLAELRPRSGNQGTVLLVRTTGAINDPGLPTQTVGLLLDHTPLGEVSLTGDTVRGVVPAGLSLGFHDVVVRSNTGQTAVAAGAFEIIPPPTLTSIDPRVGSFAGGYPATIYGSGLLKLADPEICIDAFANTTGAEILEVTDSSITFKMPTYGTAGKVRFGVVDQSNGVGALLPPDSFEFTSSPAINRLVPNLTSVLGGDQIIVTGANFKATDHVWIETTTKGTFVELTNTYVSATQHQFQAPTRPGGVYAVYVTDQFGQPSPPRTRDLTYFQFTNLNVTLPNVLPSGSDLWDGITTTVGDYDRDLDDDLFISRVGTGQASGTSQTRVLRNNGAGQFTDVTSDVLPSTSGGDDWRADRVWLADMDRQQDGYLDLCIVTNDTNVPAQTSSHVRILVNEIRGGTEANANDRVFRNRTSDLMAPLRMTNPFSGSPAVADNWRGLDMWIGDLDLNSGPPEIVITHKELKQELDVRCVPYCSSPTAANYTYGFYWGGSREFLWDRSKQGGLGQYKFNREFFPRKGGLRVPVATVPIPICNANYGSPCVGRFTPFTGKRVVVADIDIGANGTQFTGLADVAVLSDDVVQRVYPPSTQLETISSLQVALQRFNTSDGALITDITKELAPFGDTRGDTLAIGRPGYPDGSSYGVLTLAKATSSGENVLRLLKFRPATPPSLAAFDEITSQVLPAPIGNDRWQASAIAYRDIDNDGDQDLLLTANAAPGGSDPAFRVLRNEVVNQQVGIYRHSLRGLIVGDAAKGVAPLITSTEFLDGDAMSVGDVNKDGTLDFILTRNNTSSPAPETRVIVTSH
jgi:hypothetical protein